MTKLHTPRVRGTPPCAVRNLVSVSRDQLRIVMEEELSLDTVLYQLG